MLLLLLIRDVKLNRLREIQQRFPVTVFSAFLLRLPHNLVDILNVGAVVKFSHLMRPEKRHIYIAIPDTRQWCATVYHTLSSQDEG